jgi:O-antigen chain-terminating methyltransferase
MQMSGAILGWTNNVKQLIHKTIDKHAPVIPQTVRKIEEIHQQVGDLVSEMESLVDRLEKHDWRFDELRQLASEVEPYQPAYRITGVVDAPLRGSLERCHAIEAKLAPIPGRRILDIGSSLGFFSFYFADRGAEVVGWESNVKNAEVARRISEINGISAVFKTRELNDETVATIPDSEFGVVFVLSVFHHIIRFHGLEYTQKLVEALLDKIPCMVVELARKGEGPSLPWDASQPDDELAIFERVVKKVSIKKIGDFGNHLSSKTRPMYLVQKKHLAVAGHNYRYDKMTVAAYDGSPVGHSAVHRRYYFGDTIVAKEYSFDKQSRTENLSQILNETKILLDIKKGGMKVFHAPEMLDFDIIFPQKATIVFTRIQGQLASDVRHNLTAIQLSQVAQDLLRTLADLETCGLFHNDVRSWNVILGNNHRAWLIDYGLASPLATDDDMVSLLWVLHSLLNDNEHESYETNKKALPPNIFMGSAPVSKLYASIEKGQRSPTVLLAAYGR